MRKLLSFIVLLAAVALPAKAHILPELDPVSFVDPMIGTLGAGWVFPGPAAPKGMVQVSPDTEGIFAYTGYEWLDHAIRGFSMVHTEGMGVPEGGNVPLMPTTGAISTDVLSYQAPFTHAAEHAEAGYYRVDLPSTHVRAELAAGVRAGMQRYTFPATKQANVIIDAGRQVDGGSMIPEGHNANVYQSVPGTNHAAIHALDDRTIAGSTNLDHNVADNYGVHFVARFDRPFVSSGGWDTGKPGTEAVTHALPVNGQGAGAYATFDTTTSRTVTVSVGISFVSEANALENLNAELAGTRFESLVKRTRSAWRETLGALKVSGGTSAQLKSFYTALYHVNNHPSVFNDVNGEYLGHDNRVHRIGAPGDPMPAGSTYYTNFSLWDTYRGEMQLLALIDPAAYTDMIRSMTAMAEQGGRLTRWALMNRNPDYMQGEPALIVAADAFCRGLVPADTQTRLYNAMYHVMFDAPRDAVRFAPGKGYIPNNPSGTLEHSLAAFGMALVADRLGHTADRDRALVRAGDWRNTFDAAETKFFRPRNADGTFVSPFVPEMPTGWVEGTAWQYLWLVPHDIQALFKAIGPQEAAQRLDEFFSWPVSAVAPLAISEAQQKLSLYGISYQGNQYTPANETDLQAPYLYDWIGAPWKTQSIARQYQELYRPTPDGLPGNDDLGTMSAWLVWSDLGFYPATGGAPVYAMGSPAFDSVSIRVPGGKVTVESHGANEAVKYITSASINGSAMSKPWLFANALTKGTTLSFEMSAVPNPAWGSKDSDAPPSLSTGTLKAFGCS
ncbi:MAG: hypothetical protein NVSMB57_10060 [Actinomycetota bacterium]